MDGGCLGGRRQVRGHSDIAARATITNSFIITRPTLSYVPLTFPFTKVPDLNCYDIRLHDKVKGHCSLLLYCVVLERFRVG